MRWVIYQLNYQFINEMPQNRDISNTPYKQLRRDFNLAQIKHDKCLINLVSSVNQLCSPKVSRPCQDRVAAVL